jgi:archaellum biogenesis protein FlaJ (TadC family)
VIFLFSFILATVYITYFIPHVAYTYTLSIIIALGCSALSVFLGYVYPTLKASEYKKKIDFSLPFVAFYMTTTASSGINPVEIFKVLSLRGGVIGEEAKRIYTNVKTLGLNLIDVLAKTATSTPSPDFADLLWGMISVITAGGDLEGYLKNKTETLMNKYRRVLNEYARQITIYMEIYITLVIVGSLFFVVLTAIISPLTGIGVLFLQTFLVFFFVPLVSMGFIVLLKNIYPSEG